MARPRWPVGGRLSSGVILALLLIGAPLIRLLGLDSLESTIIGDEADHLTVLYRVMLGRGPGPFDLSWDGNPAASLYPALPFLALFGPSYVALRLSTAVGSLLTLVMFYLLARHTLRRFASLAATALLAFSSWYLWFSRNGEVNVWILLYGLAAAYSVLLALDSGRLRHWLAGGVFCGMGWYGYLGGIFILPILLLYLGCRAALEPARWRDCARGGAILAAVTLTLLLPRLPVLIERWAAVELYVGTRSVLRGVALADVPPILVEQLAISARAFLLLDGSLPGHPRYIQPGNPALDPLTGGLYLLGLVLSVSRLRETALWWCFLLVYAFGVHSLTHNIPDGARALPALPAMLLFAGLAVDGLVHLPRLGPIITLALTLATPMTAARNVHGYIDWQRQPYAAFDRQPAVDVFDFPAWREAQMARLRAGESGFTVTDWLRTRNQRVPRATDGTSSP